MFRVLSDIHLDSGSVRIIPITRNTTKQDHSVFTSGSDSFFSDRIRFGFGLFAQPYYFLVQPYISILNLFAQDCNLTTCFLDSAGNANPLNYYSFPYQLERLHSG